MTVNVSKPAINVREKLAELDKPTGIAGEAMLRAETPQEQFNLIGAGRRNHVINGDFQVWQRGTSFTTTFDYTADRWHFSNNLSLSISRQATPVSENTTGCKYYMRVEPNGNTHNSTFISFRHKIENVSSIPPSTDCTISFWVRSSQVTKMRIQLWDLYNNFSAYDLFGQTDIEGISSTWKRVEFTTRSPSRSGTSPVDGANMLLIQIQNLSTFSGSNTLDITGVQLEVGKVATPFEHRSYGEELAACLRYYWQVTKEKAYHNVTNMVAYDSSSAYGTLYYPVKMRTQPTFSHSSDNDFFVTGQSNNFTPVNMSASEITTWSSQLYGSTNGNYTQGSAYWLRFDSDNPSGQFFAFDAEL